MMNGNSPNRIALKFADSLNKGFIICWDSSTGQIISKKGGREENIGTAQSESEAERKAKVWLDRPYGQWAGKNEIAHAPKDSFGNADGNDYDLARDKAFSNTCIAVLHLYTGEGFDFSLPSKALAEKGFEVVRWVGPPPLREFQSALDRACQLWVISNSLSLLKQEHCDEIERYFKAGHGLYLLGDNDPYYVDANTIARRLFQSELRGSLLGDKLVGLTRDSGPGFVQHLITTGIEHLYEGITIATVDDCARLVPLIRGSAGNIVTSIYDSEGRRAVLDGGFTRLYCKWDTAGSARFVKNVAAWLANYERWGKALFSNGQPIGARSQPTGGRFAYRPV